MEDLLPVFITTLADALDFINGVIEAVRPGFEWIWQQFLEPLAQWTGGAIVEIIGAIGDAFQKLKDIIDTNSAKINEVLTGIGDVLSFLWVNSIEPTFNMIKDIVMNVFGAAVDFIGSQIQNAIDFLHGIIDFVKGVFSGDWQKAWDGIKQIFSSIWENIKSTVLFVWNSIVAVFSGSWNRIKDIWVGAWNWFNETVIQPIGRWFGGMWDGIKNGAQNAWDGIKSAFSSVADWFKNIFSKAWEAVKNVFSTGGKIFSGIKDGIVEAFKAVVNAIIKGLNVVIATPFNAINGILNGIKSVNILGFKPFDSFWETDPLKIPKIPLLAQGAVLPPNKPFLAVVGDQKRGTNVEAPISTIEEAVENVLNRRGGTGDGPYTIVLQIGNQRFGSFVLKSLKEASRQNGGLALDLR